MLPPHIYTTDLYRGWLVMYQANAYIDPILEMHCTEFIEYFGYVLCFKEVLTHFVQYVTIQIGPNLLRHTVGPILELCLTELNQHELYTLDRYCVPKMSSHSFIASFYLNWIKISGTYSKTNPITAFNRTQSTCVEYFGQLTWQVAVSDTLAGNPVV